MDFNRNSKSIQIKIMKQKKGIFNNNSDITLTNILSSEKCQNILSECREFRERIYTPIKTLITFIKQVLSPDKSCQNAVAGVVAEQIIIGGKVFSSNTGPYCKARDRLPEFAVKSLVKEIGNLAAKNARKIWKWNGREVKIVDGTTLTMPDTIKNKEFFQKHTNHAGMVGYPMARLVVLMSLATGTVVDYALGASRGKETGEHALLRSMLDSINEGDLILGDRYYPSFFLISDIISRGSDGVFPGMTARKYDFRKGKQLAKNDHIVEWIKPTKPEWMDKEAYDKYPKKLNVREFKIDGKIYVTTVLKKYSKKELSILYKFRWQIELTIRDVKITMNMDILSCKTPEMIKKEIGVHFLGYNIIRILIAEACTKNNSMPYRVSFKGALQLLNKFMPYFNGKSLNEADKLFSELLRIIATNKVGDRPDRLEPRAVKSERRKIFRTMKKPRMIEKQRLIRKRDKRTLKYAKA